MILQITNSCENTISEFNGGGTYSNRPAKTNTHWRQMCERSGDNSDHEN